MNVPSPGSDPRRRRRSGSAPDGHRHPPARPPLRQLQRSSLWDDSDATDPPGPEPLRASWSPIPEDTEDIGDAGARARQRQSAAVAVRERDAPPRPAGTATRRVRRRSAVGWFVHRYGWRAYALPVLIAATVVVVVQAFRPPAGSLAAENPPAPAPMSPATVTVEQPGPTTTVVTTEISAATAAVPAPETAASVPTAPNPNGKFSGELKAGALPPGGDFVAEGKGTWHIVKGTTEPMGSGDEKFTYTIEVEDGIESAAADRAFAQAVDGALSDPRSWAGGGDFTLRRVDSGDPDFRISLTSQKTLRDPAYCGYSIPLEASCYNSAVGRVIINNARWTRGAVSFNGDLGSYRVYAINHEVGHALGFNHQVCGEDGGLAPVMMQQSFSTANDDLHLLNPQSVAADHKVCRFNPYPYPRGGNG